LIQRLKESVYFFIGNIGPICLIVIPFALPINVFSELYYTHFVTEETGSFIILRLPTVVNLLVYPIYTGALIWYFSKVALEDSWDWNLRECLSVGIRFWPQMITVSVFSLLIIILGFLAFILPGLVLMARLAFAEFRVVIEGEPPGDAIKKSFLLTRPFQIALIFNFIILMVLLEGPQLGAAYLIGTLFSGNIVLVVVIDTVFAVLLKLVDVMFFRYYCLATERMPKDELG
jgi:hypothetical protein